VQVDVEVVARVAGVFANEPGLVGLVDGLLDVRGFLVEFTANVDVRCGLERGDGDAMRLDIPAVAFIARPATRHPSTSLCGSPRMISRSLHVPGSPSSALTTRYRGRGSFSHPGLFTAG
jgi:hypothetical protein